MHILQENPYRQLGVFANSPTKERIANHNRLKAFLKVGKQMEFPLDLPQLLSTINRTIDSVAEAEAKLTLPNEQVKYAQFWFIKSTPLDGIAFNHLFAGNIENAIETWKKKDTVSSLQNRMVCALIKEDYAAAMAYAELLYSQFSDSFVSTILGDNHTFSADNLAYDFIDTLCEEVGVNEVLPHITHTEWKEHLNEKAIKPLIDKLQAAVDTAKATRRQDANARLKAGNVLWKAANPLLKQLRTFLPKTDVQYQIIADKVGNEVLQCSIDYYNNSDAPDAARTAMTLLKHAKSIVVSKIARERCAENEKTIQEVIDNLPPQEVMAEDKAIKVAISIVVLSKKTIPVATTLLNDTKPHLRSMRSKLGADHAYYLKTSTHVVTIALGCVIKEVNDAQKNEMASFQMIKKTLQNAWDATKIMDTFDMEPDFKTGRYNQNRSILEKLCKDVGIITTVKKGEEKEELERKVGHITRVLIKVGYITLVLIRKAILIFFILGFICGLIAIIYRLIAIICE